MRPKSSSFLRRVTQRVRAEVESTDRSAGVKQSSVDAIVDGTLSSF